MTSKQKGSTPSKPKVTIPSTTPTVARPRMRLPTPSTKGTTAIVRPITPIPSTTPTWGRVTPTRRPLPRVDPVLGRERVAPVADVEQVEPEDLADVDQTSDLTVDQTGDDTGDDTGDETAEEEVIDLTITAEPEEGVIQRGLVLDGVRVEQLNRMQAEAINRLARGYGGWTEQVVQYLAAAGTFDLSTEQVADAVQRIGAMNERLMIDEEISEQDPYAVIAKQMFYDAEEQGKLGRLLPDVKGRNWVTGAQARKVREFLDQHKPFGQRLRRLPFEFGSTKARKFGGGAFLDGTVHLGVLDSVTPDTFLRLLLHESGHATFQRELLKDVTLPEKWDNGKRFALVRAKADITKTLDGSQPTIDQARLVGIDQQLEAPAGMQVWEKMSADAKALYEAWTVLRRNKGEHLLGLDLGAGRRRNQRKEYQAGAFTEFCAENFMHAAMGNLAAHVADIRDDDTVPDDVKAAWVQAEPIIGKYAARVLG